MVVLIRKLIDGITLVSNAKRKEKEGKKKEEELGQKKRGIIRTRKENNRIINRLDEICQDKSQRNCVTLRV